VTTRSRRRRRLVLHPLLVGWLVALWVLLWSDLTLANVLAGGLVALALTLFLPLSPVPFRARAHPWGLVSLLGHFAWDLVLASIQVATLALRPRRIPHGAVIRVRLRSHSDVILTTTAQFCSLIPGSIVIEAHRLTGTIYIHLLDAEIVGGVERARRHVLEQEARVLYAIAGKQEILDAGLPLRPPSRRGRGSGEVEGARDR
jgi:multicomponent Na+:H+ antiporter subunit E